MSKLIDLTGQKFGRLTVIKRVKNNGRGDAMWLCQCKCGYENIIKGYCLKNGYTKSCGCLALEVRTKHRHFVNGVMSKTYRTWCQMIQRCTNPKNPRYQDYGGRGIKVCEKWRKFEGFLQDIGERPSNMSLDRVDNDGDYCKENCKWSTRKEQCRNKRDNILFTIDGQTKCLAEWCEIYHLYYDIIYGRLYRGWTLEEALELKPRKGK